MNRKASTPVDWVVGAVFFIFLVAFTFYYANYIMFPRQPYEVVLRNAGSNVAEKVAENVTWVVKKVPVVITSNSSANWPMDVFFRLPPSAYPSTISLLDNKGVDYPYLYQGDRLYWTAPLYAGKNAYYILYSEEVNLSENIYPAEILVSGTRVNNSMVSANYVATGQDSMIFGGTELFYGSGMTLGTSLAPAITNNSVFATANYSNGVSATIYRNISKVLVDSGSSFDAELKLSASLTDFYTGGTNYSFGASNYTGISDFVDAYNTSGLAIIGSAMNLYVSDMGAYRKIMIYNISRFEIYAHNGSYTNALAEANGYASPPQFIIGVPQSLRGVSEARLSQFNIPAQEAFKAGVDITGVGFHVLFNETEDYNAIPHDRGVLVINHQIYVLGRFGVLERSYLGVAVWITK